MPTTPELSGVICATLTPFISEGGLVDVDALLIVPPFFFQTAPQEGLTHYYRTVCDALPKRARILLYHIPAITGIAITPAIIDGLLESHPEQFYGIKDSSGDAAHTANLVQRYPQLRIYSGSDTHIASSLAAGVHGVISAFSNVWPNHIRAIYDAHQQGGDVETAQAQLTAIRQSIPPTIPFRQHSKQLFPGPATSHAQASVRPSATSLMTKSRT